MSKAEETKEETVTMSKSQLESIMKRLDAVDAEKTSGNPIVERSCNSCGYKLKTGENNCPTHASEHVNHIAMGIDVETGLRRPAIKMQTRG